MKNANLKIAKGTVKMIKTTEKPYNRASDIAKGAPVKNPKAKAEKTAEAVVTKETKAKVAKIEVFNKLSMKAINQMIASGSVLRKKDNAVVASMTSEESKKDPKAKRFTLTFTNEKIKPAIVRSTIMDRFYITK